MPRRRIQVAETGYLSGQVDGHTGCGCPRMLAAAVCNVCEYWLRGGQGELLCNLREIPACLPAARDEQINTLLLLCAVQHACRSAQALDNYSLCLSSTINDNSLDPECQATQGCILSQNCDYRHFSHMPRHDLNPLMLTADKTAPDNFDEILEAKAK